MADFKAKRTLSEWSSQPPACVTRGISWMYIAWRGNDDTGLYIATLRLDLTGTTDLLQIDNYVLEHGQLDTHQFNDETSPLSPALAMLDGRLYIAWVGENNHWLNIAEVMLNADGSINSDAYGTPFLVEETDFDPDGTPHVRQHTEIDHRHIYLTNKQTLSPNTSSLAPCMTGHEGKVYLCWTGDDGDRKINVAVFDGNLSQLDSKPVFDTDGRPAATRYAPALLSAYAGDSSNRKSALILAWNSFYGEFLELNQLDPRSLQLNSSSMLIFKEKTDFGPTLTYYGTDIYIGWTERDGAQHISVGPVKQYGLNGSTFSGGFLPDKFSDRANGAATIATLTTAMGSNFAGENFLIACWAGTDTALNIGVVY